MASSVLSSSPSVAVLEEKLTSEETEVCADSIASSKDSITSSKDSIANQETTTETGVETKAATEGFLRIKKRKMVLMMSYCGQGYYGMQKNPDTRTIESEFFDAMLKANFLDQDSYNKPQTIQFQRAARTDKNVK